jgi:hypothetical protein
MEAFREEESNRGGSVDTTTHGTLNNSTGKNADNNLMPTTSGDAPPSPQPGRTAAQLDQRPGDPREKPHNRFKDMIGKKGSTGTGVHNPGDRQGQTTTTMSELSGQVVHTKPKYRIEGSNRGSAAKEPEWSTEQLQATARLSAMRLDTLLRSETRRNHPDPDGKYGIITSTGSISAKPS